MTVTAIKRTRDGSLCIYCDGEPFCSLCEEIFASSELELGGETDEQRLRELERESDHIKVKNRALGYVARRELCRWQLMRKLRDSGFDDELCSYAADEMEELGFVDDARFAQMSAEELFRDKKFGLRRVVYELTQKGVARDIAQAAAQELCPDAASVLNELLSGRLGADIDSERGLRRCRNTLERYGYESSQISAALRRKRLDNDDGDEY